MKTHTQLPIPKDSAWGRKTYNPILLFRRAIYNKWPHSFLDKNMDKYIFDPYEKVKNGLVNFWNWKSVIWKDRNWDHQYIFDILKYKLILQRKYLVESNRHTGVENLNRDITICLNLIERIQEEYYGLEPYEYHESDWKFTPAENHPGCSELNIDIVNESFDSYFALHKATVKKCLKKDRLLTSIISSTGLFAETDLTFTNNVLNVNNNVSATGLYIYSIANLVGGNISIDTTKSVNFVQAGNNAAGSFATKISGVSDNEIGRGIAVDTVGNSYVTGQYIQPSTVYNSDGTIFTTLSGSGSNDCFVVKYGPTGMGSWATLIGGSNVDQGYGIAVDNSGNPYITGLYTQSAIVYNSNGTTYTTLSGSGSQDCFIVKYENNTTKILTDLTNDPSNNGKATTLLNTFPTSPYFYNINTLLGTTYATGTVDYSTSFLFYDGKWNVSGKY
jgi:hypothetical protein